MTYQRRGNGVVGAAEDIDHGGLVGLGDDDHSQYLTAAEGAAAYQPVDTDLTSIAALDSSTAGAMSTDGAGWIRKTYAQFKTALSLTKTDVGLSNADDTADTAKPVSTAQQTALDLKVDTAQAVNAQTGTTYTLVAADAGKLVTLSNAAAITLTLPQDSDATIAIGTYVDLYALGAGQVTVVAGTGATLRVSGLTAKSRAQYARFVVQKVSANTWVAAGDLAAS